MSNVLKWNEKLRLERLRRGLSQEDLAQEIGTDARSVRYWEAGQRFPTFHFRRKLSEYFGLSLKELGLAPE